VRYNNFSFRVSEKEICGRAFGTANSCKFKNNNVSGVFAILCAHHGFFEAQGMVNLKKGER
jgi:hypothetical protein